MIQYLSYIIFKRILSTIYIYIYQEISIDDYEGIFLCILICMYFFGNMKFSFFVRNLRLQISV